MISTKEFLTQLRDEKARIELTIEALEALDAPATNGANVIPKRHYSKRRTIHRGTAARIREFLRESKKPEHKADIAKMLMPYFEDVRGAHKKERMVEASLFNLLRDGEISENPPGFFSPTSKIKILPKGALMAPKRK